MSITCVDCLAGAFTLLCKAGVVSGMALAFGIVELSMRYHNRDGGNEQ
jgi:hypothetical protein